MTNNSPQENPTINNKTEKFIEHVKTTLQNQYDNIYLVNKGLQDNAVVWLERAVHSFRETLQHFSEEHDLDMSKFNMWLNHFRVLINDTDNEEDLLKASLKHTDTFGTYVSKSKRNSSSEDNEEN